MLGSGYSQVPLASESALASFETTTATDVIKAQRGDRDKPILEIMKDGKMMLEKS